MKTKTDIKTLGEVCKKFEELCAEGKQSAPERINLMMDFESADRQFEIDWEALLADDGFNAVHDLFGIVNNMNRSHYPGTVENCFVPRFARG